MDLRHDRRLPRRNVFRSSICDSHRHRNSDRFFQRSHCHCKCSKQSQKPSIHEVVELVLLGYDDVLSLWGERSVLLQAYCAGRQGLVTFRNPP